MEKPSKKEYIMETTKVVNLIQRFVEDLNQNSLLHKAIREGSLTEAYWFYANGLNSLFEYLRKEIENQNFLEFKFNSKKYKIVATNVSGKGNSVITFVRSTSDDEVEDIVEKYESEFDNILKEEETEVSEDTERLPF